MNATTRTPALFGIAPGTADDLFPGVHDPSRTWNGWACPSFTRETVDAVLAWMGDGGDLAFTWTGDVLHVVNEDEGDAYDVRPDADGLYPLGAGGWVWDAFTADEVAETFGQEG